MTKIIPTLLFLTLANLAISQDNQVNRIEIDMGAFDDVHCFNTGRHGVFIVKSNLDYRNRQTVWNIHFVDTALNIQNKFEYRFGYARKHIFTTSHRGNPYALFLDLEKKRVEVVKFENPSGAITLYEIVSPFVFELENLHITAEAALLSGTYKNKPVVLHYSFQSNKTKVVPGFQVDNSRIVQLKANPDASFDVLVMQPTLNNWQGLVIKTYSKDGNFLGESSLAPTDRHLSMGRMQRLPAGDFLLTGTWSQYLEEDANGFFMAITRPDDKGFVSFYNYADLDNFFSYRGDRRENRLRRRLEKKQNKGKGLSFSYQMLLHEPLETDSMYLLLSEVYHPAYKPDTGGSDAHTTYGIYSAGFRFTHAVVAGFEKNGALAWDYSIELKNITVPELRHLVYAHTKDETIILVHEMRGKIQSQQIHNSRLAESKEVRPIELMYSSDKVIDFDEKDTGFEKWYGDKFYVYGIQRIKNKANKAGTKNRRVFYLNKINSSW